MNKHFLAADWTEHITINRKEIQLKLDTGAQCNVMPLHSCEAMNFTIEKCPTKSRISYNEHRIPVIGQVTTNCIVRGAPVRLTFKIGAEKFQPILGRASCEFTKLICRVRQIKDDIFSGLGCLKGFEYELDFIQNPKFEIKPALRVSHAIKDRVKLKIDNMVRSGVIVKLDKPTQSASPMMIVKKNDRIRISIDPSDLNKNIIRRQIPAKTVKEITAKVFGSTFFTLLDCKRGLWMFNIAEKSQQYLKFLCLAPEIFQKVITNLLGDIDGVEVSMDNILIFTKSHSNTAHETQHREV
jgi:CxxC motif-containing protein